VRPSPDISCAAAGLAGAASVRSRVVVMPRISAIAFLV